MTSGEDTGREDTGGPQSMRFGTSGAAALMARSPRPLLIRAALLALVSLLFLVALSAARSQPNTPEADDPADWKESDAGFPVRHELTVQVCGTCHMPDEDGNLSRISWIRATPEGWSQTIKRMVSLHGLQITPAEAREIVGYLGTHHGLAPEEAEPVMYITERRRLDETNIPNEAVRGACASCHAFGQPLSSRRSRTEWALLQNMHVALYSQAQRQFDRPASTGDSDEAEEGGDDTPTQGEVALEWLAEHAPLHTAEWSAWRPRISQPKLAGTWLVTATLRGHGKYVGEMNISPGTAPADFVTRTSLRALDGGETITRTGEGAVYTGYSWRGRSSAAGEADAPGSPQNAARETMWFAPDQQSAKGRWYWGDYHEFGFDVEMKRVGSGPALAGIVPAAIPVGAKGVEVQLIGSSLPIDLEPGDLDFGPGISVRRILSSDPSQIRAELDVAADATPGLHDAAVPGAVLAKALPVYDQVDYLQIVPETALTHLGGIKYPKGFEQFEVLGFSNGPDGEPETADDFGIGPVSASWSLVEFPTTTYDNDTDYVGTLTPAGFFTPATEGPNPDRRFGRNNYGEVWVEATASDLSDAFGEPLSARSYLVVTVPQYRRWDQPEVTP